MKVISKVPIDVLLSALKGEIQAINKGASDFSKSAYQILRDKSGFNSFFFGVKVDKYALDDYYGVYEVCDNSNRNNKIMVMLDIPDEETYSVSYPLFCDLIHYSGSSMYSMKGVVETVSQKLDKELEGNYIQVTYPKLKPEYIKGVLKNSFDVIPVNESLLIKLEQESFVS